MSSKPHLVIDLGSDNVKAGFCGEEGPRSVFPCVIGRETAPGVSADAEYGEYFVGVQAVEKRGILNLNSPVQHGIIEDWDGIEKILDHTFRNELRVNPSDFNVLITQNHLSPKISSEKLTQMMFDTFDVQEFCIVDNAIASLYTTGRSTGLIVDSGDGATRIAPVFDGYIMSNSALRINLAGRDLTDYLAKLLSEGGIHDDRTIIRDIKESTCHVTPYFEKELIESQHSTAIGGRYEMPDGSAINIGSEQFRIPEAMFKPSLIGKEFPGIHQQVCQAIEKCDFEVRRELYQNIFLSGGNNLFPGFAQRLAEEVKKIAPQSISAKVNVSVVPEAKCSSWIGASMLSSQSGFCTHWITREEYQESGPSVIHRKSF